MAGIRSALRGLLMARRAIDTRRTADRTTLTAKLRSFDLGVDARKPVTNTQIGQIAAWRARPGDDEAMATIRAEAHRLAAVITTATLLLEENMTALARHLFGVAPISASSGNTTRHRLSRGGDRQLNRALDTIARARLNGAADTGAYAGCRTAQGRTPKEIKRCLKRYIARQLFRPINTLMD